MIESVNTDAVSAWNALVSAGGIEPNGRDSDLVEDLRGHLNPLAPSLESALRDASLNDFARAFFCSVQPFVLIVSGILDFFTQAKAFHGQTQWRLALDGEEFGLGVTWVAWTAERFRAQDLPVLSASHF